MSRKREKGRGLFGRGRQDDDEDDCVEIDDEANSWWADRENLNHRVNPPRQGRASESAGHEQASKGAFQSYFTTESLFEDSARRAPCPEPTEPADPPKNATLPAYPGHGRDPFEVLGVRPGATLAEITVRHRQLAKLYHPDLHEVATRFEAEQIMIEVNAAYSELRRVLRNVERMRVSAS